MANQKKKTEKKKVDKIGVLFVCTGNTCRSAMAEYLFKDYLRKKKKLSKFSVSGAGIAAENSQPMSSNALKALEAREVKGGEKHKSRQLTLKIAEKADLIVCMTEGHRRAVGDLEKIVSVAGLTGGVDISDPYGQYLDVYIQTAEQIFSALARVEEAAEMIKKITLAQKAAQDSGEKSEPQEQI